MGKLEVKVYRKGPVVHQSRTEYILHPFEALCWVVSLPTNEDLMGGQDLGFRQVLFTVATMPICICLPYTEVVGRKHGICPSRTAAVYYNSRTRYGLTESTRHSRDTSLQIIIQFIPDSFKFVMRPPNTDKNCSGQRQDAPTLLGNLRALNSATDATTQQLTFTTTFTSNLSTVFAKVNKIKQHSAGRTSIYHTMSGYRTMHPPLDMTRNRPVLFPSWCDKRQGVDRNICSCCSSSIQLHTLIHNQTTTVFASTVAPPTAGGPAETGIFQAPPYRATMVWAHSRHDTKTCYEQTQSTKTAPAFRSAHHTQNKLHFRFQHLFFVLWSRLDLVVGNRMHVDVVRSLGVGVLHSLRPVVAHRVPSNKKQRQRPGGLRCSCSQNSRSLEHK